MSEKMHALHAKKEAIRLMTVQKKKRQNKSAKIGWSGLTNQIVWF
jgi:hypothetical protein